MSTKGFLSFLGIMGSLFFISVGYNACSNDTAFLAENGYDQVALPSEEEIVEPLAAPTPQILINDGVAFANQEDVNLTLSTGTPMNEMLISNDKYCSSGVWEAFRENREWKLPAKNKSTAVYVQYRDSIEDEPTPCVKDDILHDDIAPELIVNAAIQNGWVGVPQLDVLYTATDQGSGVKAMECTNKRGGAYKYCQDVEKYTEMKESKTYQFHVRASDKAGNMSPKTDLFWNVDLTPPVVTFNERPANITADTTPTFSFIGLDNGSGVRAYDCDLDNAATYTACPNEQTLSGLSDGAHTLTVRAIDNVGHISIPVEHSWVQDTTAPTVEFVQTPDRLSNSGDATFAFRGLDGGVPLSSFQCRLDAGNWVACTSPSQRSGLADGSHSFSVIGQDAAGNRSAAQTYSWIIDTKPPTLSFVSTPDKLTNDPVANFQIFAEDNAGGSNLDRLECQRDSGAYAVCTKNYQWQPVSNGSHSLSVRAYDMAGNVSAPIAYTWTVDLVAPTIRITKNPQDPTNAVIADFEFEGSDSGSQIAGYSCRLDGGALASCASPMSYADLSEGAHSFAVQATDGAGNKSNFATYNWNIDRTGPVISFVKQPAATVNVGSAPVVLFRIEDASGIQSHNCSLNGSVQECAIDLEFQIPAPNQETFNLSVVAVDGVGNVTTETITWRSTFETIEKVKEIEVDGSRPVDILIVIDDSGSMNYERKSMGDRIDGLLSKLQDLDWQIALVSTDVRSNTIYDGNLIKMRGLNNKYILNSAMDPVQAQAILGDTIENYRDKGSGAEMGIWATKRAIDRYEAGSSIHEDFFRDGADFSVVLLSDEDENSKGVNVKMQPQEFVDHVNDVWNGQKNLTWHSIIAKPGDTPCLGEQPSGPHYAGVKYLELSTLTGYEPPENRGPAGTASSGTAVVGSVCETDYTTQLQTIGQSVRDMQKSASLDCVPADSDPVSVSYQSDAAGGFSDYSGAFQLQGQKIVFDDFLPAGNFKINYSCVVK